MKFLKKYWPSILVLAVILYATLSSDPLGADELPSIPHIDKLIHATMMGGFFGAIVFDMQRADKSCRLSKIKLYVIALGLMAFSLADEMVQSAMEQGRSGDLYDMLADWTGILVAFFAAPPAVRAVLKM